MATPPSSLGLTATTPNRIIFDAGAMYKSWDSSPVLLGATRGGAQLDFTRTMRQIEVDGIRGQVKGLKRIIDIAVKLTVHFSEVSDQLIKELLYQVSKTSPNAGLHTFQPDFKVDTGDYASNYALVAPVAKSSTGAADATNCVFELMNGLVTGGWQVTTKDKDEGQLGPVVFEAHFDPAAPTAVPFKIHWPTGAS